MKISSKIIFGLIFIMILSAVGISARDGSRRGRGDEFRGGEGYHGYQPYYGWGFGTYVTYLPDGYSEVIVDGNNYYYAGGFYLAPYSAGYVVVPEPQPAAVETTQKQNPAVTEQATPSSEPVQVHAKSTSNDTTRINVPNIKGGFTSVRLIKYKTGYIGPQGEFYAGHPTVDALKALYGG